MATEDLEQEKKNSTVDDLERLEHPSNKFKMNYDGLYQPFAGASSSSSMNAAQRIFYEPARMPGFMRENQRYWPIVLSITIIILAFICVIVGIALVSSTGDLPWLILVAFGVVLFIPGVSRLYVEYKARTRTSSTNKV
ncbi:MAG: hypothetical protein EZS28_003144 [Streblomastix strix]|uniref:Uncharacterized protein n=1 Tax=Streblomastix strix TaxID=222440 RepID=A0A5J4X3K5_9EUKA|nr:MAG: hypothetical protein EZS28_003137 [Streblomastix strix]KAA6401336.1 MAG: hypothetical protein EZS28_003144 [Streblomastix strix]